jgi:RNA polymerase sigma-70 factor (ECF subfamily)
VPVPHDDFAEFYEASYRRVVALVAAIVGNRHQAEDIAQEAFARALTRWPQVGRYDLPEAWVRRVALRLTVDAGRRMRRALALARLPLPQRQVVVLYYLADLKVEDIARDCEVSVSTVRTRLAAARHRLERELSEADDSEQDDSEQEVPGAR